MRIQIKQTVPHPLRPTGKEFILQINFTETEAPQKKKPGKISLNYQILNFLLHEM